MSILNLLGMEEITFQEFLLKSGQILEKYRSNISHLKQLRDNIERQFFTPEEMVAYFHANKSEYFTWQQTQDSIITLEDAFSELVGNMMDARGAPENFKYHLRDKRIPVLTVIEEEGKEQTQEELEEEIEDLILESLKEEGVLEETKEEEEETQE